MSDSTFTVVYAEAALCANCKQSLADGKVLMALWLHCKRIDATEAAAFNVEYGLPGTVGPNEYGAMGAFKSNESQPDERELRAGDMELDDPYHEMQDGTVGELLLCPLCAEALLGHLVAPPRGRQITAAEVFQDTVLRMFEADDED